MGRSPIQSTHIATGEGVVSIKTFIKTLGDCVCTVESRDYAPPFCMIALGKSGEGAYTRDRDISA